MEKNNKRYLVYGVIAILLLITGITVAWLTWRSNNTNISITSGCFTINYSKGQDIEGASLKLLNENNIISNNNITITEGMAITTASIGINSTCNIEGYGILKLNVNSLSPAFTTGNSVGALKYAVVSYDPSTYPNVTVANLNNASFSILSTGSIESTGTIDIHTEQLSNTTVNNYIIIIYIDGSRAGNDIIGSTFSGTISAEANQGDMPRPVNLVTKIVSLYNPDGNTTPTVNDITYNLDTTNKLMEDIGGNIRYYGANPNNYIDIGEVYEEDFLIKNWELNDFESEEDCYQFNQCALYWEDYGYENVEQCYSSEYSVSSVEELCDAIVIPSGTPILYRIIGVFKDMQLADGTRKDLVKIMRNDSIGDYSWDTSSSTVNEGVGINEWSQADLMKLLNPGFGNNTGELCTYNSETSETVCNGTIGLVNNSLWWNSDNGNCYNGTNNATISCDFRSIGFKNDKIKNLIAEHIWSLRGSDDLNEDGYSRSSVDEAYTMETSTGTVIESPSDGVTRTTSWIGKIALPYMSDYGYAADLSLCYRNLNRYDSVECASNNWMYNSSAQWLLTPFSSSENLVWFVFGGGVVATDIASSAYSVRPSFYLNSDVSLGGGTGASNDPYTLDVK